MSLLDYIERLQKKPDSFKYVVVLTSTVVMMGIIILLWLSLSLFPSLEKKPANTESQKGPFTIIKDNFLEAYGALKGKK